MAFRYVKKAIQFGLDALRAHCPAFQRYIYYSNYNIEDPHLFYHFRDMVFVYHPDLINSVRRVFGEYNFDDLREDDVVLDIGANIGGFTCFAALRTKHVYAVEPLYSDILKKNVELNGLENVTIFDIGVGSGTETTKLKYLGREKQCTLRLLSNIMTQIPQQVTFLKMDCEGCEWNTDWNDLKGIRHVEAEVHRYGHKHATTLYDNGWFETMLRNEGFCIETRSESDTKLIHAVREIK